MATLKTRFCTTILFVLSLYVLLPAFALDVPALKARVNDYENVLSSGEKNELEAFLADFEKKTSIQIAVLNISTTEGVPIEDFGIKVAEAWKIGQSGKDNGVVIISAIKDRKVRIEVGYGLEEKLTDALCKKIIMDKIIPNYRSENYFLGLKSALIEITKVISFDAGKLLAGEIKLNDLFYDFSEKLSSEEVTRLRDKFQITSSETGITPYFVVTGIPEYNREVQTKFSQSLLQQMEAICQNSSRPAFLLLCADPALKCDFYYCKDTNARFTSYELGYLQNEVTYATTGINATISSRAEQFLKLVSDLKSGAIAKALEKIEKAKKARRAISNDSIFSGLLFIPFLLFLIGFFNQRKAKKEQKKDYQTWKYVLYSILLAIVGGLFMFLILYCAQKVLLSGSIVLLAKEFAEGFFSGLLVFVFIPGFIWLIIYGSVNSSSSGSYSGSGYRSGSSWHSSGGSSYSHSSFSSGGGFSGGGGRFGGGGASGSW